MAEVRYRNSVSGGIFALLNEVQERRCADTFGWLVEPT
jgi:hypothetical protein